MLLDSTFGSTTNYVYVYKVFFVNWSPNIIPNNDFFLPFFFPWCSQMEGRVPAELEEAFGEEALDHTLVLLTCGDYLMGRKAEVLELYTCNSNWACDTLTQELKWCKLVSNNDTSFCVNSFRHPCRRRQPNTYLNCFPQDYLQREDPGLRQIIERCGGRYHVINNRQQQNREQVLELLEKVRSWRLTGKRKHTFCSVYI